MTGVKDTAYTDDDMREFGKDILREWRRAYRAETDPVEEEKLTRRKKNSSEDSANAAGKSQTHLRRRGDMEEIHVTPRDHRKPNHRI